MKFILAIDYDGTLFDSDLRHNNGPHIAVVQQTLRFCNHPGCDVILWTCREGVLLAEAVKMCEQFDIIFDAVNTNSQETIEFNQNYFGRQGDTCGRKIFADLYVDDRAPGSIEYFLKLDPEVEFQKKVQQRKNT